jgi:hypothetical protein
VALTLPLHKHGPTTPREQSMNMVIAQIGWIGHTGVVYRLDQAPTSHDEPGGFAPLLISVGTWTDLGDGRWGISD